MGLLVFIHQLQADRPRSSSTDTGCQTPGRCVHASAWALPTAPRPPGVLRRHCPDAPCGARAPCQPCVQLGLCACSAHRSERCQLPAAAAQSRWGGAGRKQRLFLRCLISTASCQVNTPRLHYVCRLSGPHLCTSRHTSHSGYGRHQLTPAALPVPQQVGLTFSKDFFHKHLFPQPITNKQVWTQ